MADSREQRRTGETGKNWKADPERGGHLVVAAKTSTLLSAAEAIAGLVEVKRPGAALLPDVENLRVSSATVAVAVARQAAADGVAIPLNLYVRMTAFEPQSLSCTWKLNIMPLWLCSAMWQCAIQRPGLVTSSRMSTVSPARTSTVSFHDEVRFGLAVAGEHEEPAGAVDVERVVHRMVLVHVVDEADLHPVADAERPVDLPVLLSRVAIDELPDHVGRVGCPLISGIRSSHSRPSGGVVASWDVVSVARCMAVTRRLPLGMTTSRRRDELHPARRARSGLRRDDRRGASGTSTSMRVSSSSRRRGAASVTRTPASCRAVVRVRLDRVRVRRSVRRSCGDSNSVAKD